MDLLRQFVDIFLHLDAHLSEVISAYGVWTYAILFLIVFLETGVVVTPFLPGDSLLFAAGTFAALGALDVRLLFVLLTVAAIIGDTLNYAIGNYIGPRAFTGQFRLLKREHLERTQAFYDRHGGKTIILARFVPIVRTFAPFVAGVGTMHYARFISYNVVGAVTWVALFTFGGYFFGNIPAVRANFTLVILAIVGLSVLPMVLEYLRSRRARPAT
jgi:membrane-associated protein